VAEASNAGDGARHPSSALVAAVAVPTIQSTTLAPDDGLAPLSLSTIVETLELEAPRYPLEEQVEVTGETHHIKDIRRVFRDHDMPITAAGTTLDALRCVLVPQTVE
jgi:hypothetical protein